MTLFWKTMRSPVGELRIVASDEGLVAILWENDSPSRVAMNGIHEDRNQMLLIEAKRQLAQYFGRERTAFSLPLDFRGTDFQKRVWSELLAIPYGETRSYADIAKRVGNAKACRAVGAANGRNPISIVAPCHRVVGSTGKLTGFAGGLRAKEFLLQLEAGNAEGSYTLR